MARSSIGYSDRIVDLATIGRRLFLCGVNMPRVVERAGLTGGRIKGWLLEPAATQLMRYTRTFDSWTKARVTVPSQAELAPDGSSRACILHEDATAANSHYVLGATTANVTAGVTYAFSVYVKPINRQWVAFLIQSGGGNRQVWFNALTGAIGTKTAGITTHWIENHGDYKRCVCTHPADATGACSLFIGAASADNVFNFDGLDQDSLLLWGAQVEALNRLSSHIINDGTTSTTRTSDTAPYWTNDYPNAQRGHAQTRVLLPAHTPAADITILDITDGTKYLRIKAAASTGYLTFVSSDGGETSIATNICDGEIHVLDAEWTTGAMQCWLDGVASVADTTVTIPTGLTRIQLGVTGGVTGYTRVWPTPLPELPQVGAW